MAAVVGAGGVLIVLAYAGWWAFGGGRYVETERRMEALLASDPEVAARDAVRKNDFRLYTLNALSSSCVVPGIGYTEESYEESFGYKAHARFYGEDLSAHEQALNDRVRAFMERYNRIVYAEASRRFPDWREEYERRKKLNLSPLRVEAED